MADVLIDARNVLRSRWPNPEEPELVALCQGWARRRGHRVHLVFDGRAPGGVIGEKQLCERSMVVGSGPESADDVIARQAEAWGTEGRPYELVTSDRELRRRAGLAAGRIVGGGAFLGELFERS